MSWWKPLLIILTLPVVLLLLQVVSYQGVALIEGSGDPFAPTITPLKFLAVNVSTWVTGLLAVVLTLVWPACRGGACSAGLVASTGHACGGTSAGPAYWLVSVSPSLRS